MQNPNKNNQDETHPLFPSGEWEGFYTYYQGPGAEQHKMSFMLTFRKLSILGMGGDDVGSFSWKGNYDLEALTCSITKHYSTHRVYYSGHVDENGIWGMWNMGEYSKGGFHIWPKKNSSNAAQKEAEEVKEMVKIEIKRHLKK